jgi:hypothetical protein
MTLYFLRFSCISIKSSFHFQYNNIKFDKNILAVNRDSLTFSRMLKNNALIPLNQISR